MSPPFIVFGGGALGAAVARLATSGGASVTVASPSAREHAGWWRGYRIGGTSRLDWVPEGADVVIAVGPGAGEVGSTTWGPAFAGWLSELAGQRPRAVLLAGPAGVGGGGLDAFEQSSRTALGLGAAVVRFPALLALGSGWVGSLAASLRSGQRPRVSTALPSARALVADDAARVVLAELGGGRDVVATGSSAVSAASLVAALSRRYGHQVRGRLFGTGLSRDVIARLAAQEALDDRWDEDRYGTRLSMDTWVERLPGPRRRPTR